MSSVRSPTLSKSRRTWKTLARQSSNKTRSLSTTCSQTPWQTWWQREAAKRLALVQAGIWAKRSEAGVFYELDPLLVEEATCTRTVLSTVVDELAPRPYYTSTSHQRSAMQSEQCVQSQQTIQFLEPSPLFSTAKRRRCHLPIQKQEKTAHQQVSRKLVSLSRPFWRTQQYFQQTRRERTLALHLSGHYVHTTEHHPLPGREPELDRTQSCNVTFSQSGDRSKTSSKHDDQINTSLHFIGWQDIQCTHSHSELLNLPVSLEPEVDLAHTHQCCDYSISQAAEQSGESQHVLTKLHGCGMEGKRREIASFADPGGPRAPLRSNFDDPEGWDTSGSEEECAQRDVVHRMALVAGRPVIKCGTSGCTGSCSLSVMENGYNAGKKPATCRTCGKIFPRPNISGIKSRIASPTRSQKSSVSSWSEALCEQSRSQVDTVLPAAMAPVRPASGCLFLLVSLLQVNTPLFLVCLLDLLPVCKAYLALIVQFPMDSAESSRCHVPRSSVHPASRCFPLLVSRSQVNMP